MHAPVNCNNHEMALCAELDCLNEFTMLIASSITLKAGRGMLR